MNVKSSFKHTLIFLVVCVLISGFGFSSEKVKPKVKKGAEVITAVGTLVHWKDVAKVDLSKLKTPRKLKPIMNFENPRKLQKPGEEFDPVAQDSFTGKGNELKKEALAMSEPDIDFAGMNQSANGAGWPPDTNGDVGPTYFIQTVNTSIGIYNKSTGALDSATTFDAFFPSSVGAPCDADNNGDPIVLYDRYNERWFILDFAWDGEDDGSYFSIAASQTSDPTGSWYTYCFHANTTLMDDYPKCGVWHDGIYITANMFQFSGSFQYTQVWAIKTPDLYTGTLTSQTVTDSGDKAFSLLPSSAKSPTAPSSSSPNYMYAMDADEYGGSSVDGLYVWKYDVDWDNSSNTTWTGPSEMLTASFGLVATGVPQQGTTNTLDSLYGRLMYPANYWNYGTHESVFLSHVVEYSSRRAMRWYEIRISSGTSSIYQQGTYSPDSNHRWMGAVAGDKNGNIAMGYSVSSGSMYPGIRYCGRLSTDTLGEMSQGEATMVSGGGYQSSYSRWGDYSSIFIDPDDGETFWYTQEYYTSSGTNWQTRIGSFKVEDGGTTPPGDLSDAMDTTATFTTTCGDAGFDIVTDEFYNDDDSAKSDTITHNQTSCMETTVTLSEQCDIKFYWKVSSESGYDYLRFYIDDTLQDSIAGTVDWEQKVYNKTAGTYTLKWEYYKDGSVSSGSDCGWVDFLEIVPNSGTGCTDDIAVALDDADCNSYSNSGDELWEVTTADYQTGDSSMVAPAALGNSEDCTIQTTISGYTSVSFYWKVSSETNYDYLEFYIDGTRQDRISGTVAWQQKSYTLTSGSHTLKWVYDKDGSVSSGSDCGWVDNVVFGTGGGTPTYCTASGNNTNYEWVAQVQVADIDNSSSAQGYTDFTSVTGNLTRGNSASVTLTPGFASSSYTEYWKIWIDYNQDGDFEDSGEEVFSDSGSSAVSGSFTVSSSASTGNTRMRVIMKYSSAADSCGTFTYGEVEDYTVNIQ